MVIEFIEGSNMWKPMKNVPHPAPKEIVIDWLK
jgi:hypothetical protein